MYNEAYINNIPLEIRDLKQWTVYKSYLDKDTNKYKKIIISPVNSKFAKSDSAETWGDFYSTQYYCRKNRYHGMVFALTKDIVFIDLDNAVNKETGEIVSAEAKQLLELLPDTYAERSVSGTGIHILCKGNLPEDVKRRNDSKGIEMYDNRRFICMTGDVIDRRFSIKDYSNNIADIAYRFVGKRPLVSEYFAPTAAKTQSDSDLIEAILSSRQSVKFQKLYLGDKSDYLSHSQADAAFVCILAWWTQDSSQIDSIYRSSGLMRQKWDSKRGNITYGQMIINSAMSKIIPRNQQKYINNITM